MKVLAYTFRTFPSVESLRIIFPKVFIFSALKKDLDDFFKLIESEKPDLVIGIAASKKRTQFEPVAVNRFNMNGQVTKDGPELYELYVPDITGITVSRHATTSFCNWTMYKISHFLASRDSQTYLVFCHIRHEDLALLSKFSGCKRAEKAV